MDNKLIEKIWKYVNEEENFINDEIRPSNNKGSKTTIKELDLDDLFGSNDNDIEKSKNNNSFSGELDFRNKEKPNFYKLINENKVSNNDFLVLKDAINIVRGKYFINDTYKTIDKSYQEMCNLFIKLQLQKNDLGIFNFLRYFDPETAYYKRVKALTLFRYLNDPREEIDSVRDDVCKLLYEASKLEPDRFNKSLNILQEYIERVFTIKHTDYDSRMDFILKSSDAWDVRFSIPTFSERIIKYINGEVIEINRIKDIPEEISENINEKLLNEKIDEQSDIIKELLKEIAKNEKAVNDANTEKEIAEAKKDEAELRYTQIIEKLKQSENTKQEYLESIKKKQEENEELKKQIKTLIKANEISKSEIKKEKINIVERRQENILEKRQYYRITVVGGSDKTNKKYNQLLKTGFNGELYEKFGIKKEQLGELYGDYNKQHNKSFEKKIEEDLITRKINFVIVLQTDHETGLYNLVNNSDFGSRITYFAEREENNKNPKYTDQSFSKERFFYYLNRAIEKYERSETNNIS